MLELVLIFFQTVSGLQKFSNSCFFFQNRFLFFLNNIFNQITLLQQSFKNIRSAYTVWSKYMNEIVVVACIYFYF